MLPIRRVWRLLPLLALLAAALPPASAQAGSVRSDTLSVLDARLAVLNREAAALDADLAAARADLQRLQTARAELDAERARFDADTRAYQTDADQVREDADFLRRLYEDLRRDGSSAVDRRAYDDARFSFESDTERLRDQARGLADANAALTSGYDRHAAAVRDLVARAQSMNQRRSALMFERETLAQRRLRLAARRAR